MWRSQSTAVSSSTAHCALGIRDACCVDAVLHTLDFVRVRFAPLQNCTAVHVMLGFQRWPPCLPRQWFVLPVDKELRVRLSDDALDRVLNLGLSNRVCFGILVLVLLAPCRNGRLRTLAHSLLVDPCGVMAVGPLHLVVTPALVYDVVNDSHLLAGSTRYHLLLALRLNRMRHCVLLLLFLVRVRLDFLKLPGGAWSHVDGAVGGAAFAFARGRWCGVGEGRGRGKRMSSDLRDVVHGLMRRDSVGDW